MFACRFAGRVLRCAAPTGGGNGARSSAADAARATTGNLSEEETHKAYTNAILEKDRELLDLKRLHELSLLRVEDAHRRRIDGYEERAIYFETAVNNVTLQAVSTQDHDTKKVQRYGIERGRLRTVKVLINFLVAFLTCLWLRYRYCYNSKRYYVEKPRTMWGSGKYEQRQ